MDKVKEDVKKFLKSNDNSTLNSVVTLIVGLVLLKVVKNSVLFVLYFVAIIGGYFLLFDPEKLKLFIK